MNVVDLTPQQVSNPVPLRRRGSWLIAPCGSWQMVEVKGPLEARSEKDRQYFHVHTACEELLLVSRPQGERGMRELRLDSILEPRAQRSA